MNHSALDETIFDDEDFRNEDFAEIDAFIEHLRTLQRPSISVLNRPRKLQMRFSCAMIKRLLRETGSRASIECKHHEFKHSVGVVRVEGVELAVTNMEGFARAAEFASNIEVYPLEANKVRMALTFRNLTIPVS